jgi:ABC-type cobalamin transport system permease subunit
MLRNKAILGHRLILVVVAFGIVAAAVLPYGPGHSPDSGTYLAAARSMTHLRGYLDLDGQSPMLDFPPLYPAVLTFFAFCGASFSTAADLVDALSLACLALAVRSLAPTLR